MESVRATQAAAQLWWLDHASGASDSRLATIVIYGELAEGNRRQGGQKFRYKDVAKRHLKAIDLDVNNWVDEAAIVEEDDGAASTVENKLYNEKWSHLPC